MGLLGSEDSGLGSVLTAAGDTDGGGGGGGGDPVTIGKFTGALFTSEGATFAYLSDPGLDVAFAASNNQVDAPLYPTGARTFKVLRVTASNGNGATPYTVTLYKNGVPTAQQVTVPAGAAAGAVFTDGAHAIAFTAGQKFDLRADKAGSPDGPALISAVLEGPAGGGGGGGGGGLVDSVTGSAPGVVDNSDPANPVVQAQFGADTLIQLPNNAAALVHALELITSLTTGTAGSEASQWLTKFLLAGAVVNGPVLNGNGILLPLGSQSAPALAPAASPSSGIWFNGSGQTFVGRGAGAISLFSTNLFAMLSQAGQILVGVDNLSILQRLSANGGWQALIGNSDFVVGTGTPLGAGTSVGFLRIPTVNGIPTALPTETLSATVAAAFVEAAGPPISPGPWVCIPNTPNQWRKVARGGKGTDVASAGTLTVLPAERTACDYFHLTGATAVDFLSYHAADVYDDIQDGEAITFYVVTGLTIHNNTGSPPASAHPFKLVGGVDAPMAAGSKICFRRDDALGFWVEMFRTAA